MPLQLMNYLPILVAQPSPRFGFVAYAETWNGRLAMLGFVIGLASQSPRLSQGVLMTTTWRWRMGVPGIEPGLGEL